MSKSTNSSTGVGAAPDSKLDRVISLPMLIFYGVGVTVGAGIFALSGEIIGISGDLAPYSFLLAALIAGFTAVSYSLLSRESPRAAGEAWFVRQAFGERASVLVGLMLVVSALFSSAAITVSFSNYISEIIALPKQVLMLMVLLLLALVAWKGVKETVFFAAVITLIEVGALLVVVVVGMPQVASSQTLQTVLTPDLSGAGLPMIFSGAVVAFFAFIGFEDIVNMGEETINAERNLPIAILVTLFFTLLIYTLVSLVCVAVADRDAFLNSNAPLAYVFEAATGRDAWAISVCAAVAVKQSTVWPVERRVPAPVSWQGRSWYQNTCSGNSADNTGYPVVVCLIATCTSCRLFKHSLVAGIQCGESLAVEARQG